MSIKISYSNKIIKSSTANTVLFSKDKFSLSGLKSYLSNNEFSYINDLLKNSDLKKNLLVFELSSKRKIVLILVKKNIKTFVSACYLISFLLIIFVLKMNLGINLSTFFVLMFLVTLIFQIKIFSEDDPVNCLKAFKINNLSGAFVFLSILF